MPGTPNTLTLTSSLGGTVAASGSNVSGSAPNYLVNSSMVVAITATPNSGYTFLNWSISGTPSGFVGISDTSVSSTTLAFTTNSLGSASVQANFAALLSGNNPFNELSATSVGILPSSVFTDVLEAYGAAQLMYSTYQESSLSADLSSALRAKIKSNAYIGSQVDIGTNWQAQLTTSLSNGITGVDLTQPPVLANIAVSPQAWCIQVAPSAGNLALQVNFVGITSLTFNWGDGNIQTVTSGSGITHTYSSAGTYNLQITGTSQRVAFNGTGQSMVTAVTSPLLGITGIVDFLSTFNGCSNLASIPVDMFRYYPDVVTFNYTFAGTKLTSLPSTLFKYNTQVTSFIFTFGNLYSLTAVPADLFKYNTKVTSFSTTFSSTGLTSIPSSLFQYNTLVTDFSSTFIGCVALATLPANLFQYNTKVTSFSTTFSSTGLTSIPSGLFQYNTLVTSFSGVFANIGLTSIPVDLFRYNTLVTTFNQAFSSNSSLTALPSDLFRYNTQVTIFTGTFSNCTALATIPVDTFRYNTAVTTFALTFYGCAGLVTLPSAFFQYNTAVTTFDGTFGACSNLATLSSNLFAYNTQVTAFTGTFQNCSKLTLTSDMFGTAYSTRFLNQSPSFTNLFQISSWIGSTQGIAPTLWNFNYGTGAPQDTSGAFASTTAAELSNYYDIPVAWGGPTGMWAPQFVTTVANTVVTVNYTLTTPVGVGLTIVWGDGNSQTFTTGSSVTHTYVATGTYNAQITGAATNIYFQNQTTLKAILQPLQGVTGITSLGGLFQGTGITAASIPTDIFKYLPNITNVGACFESCSGLTSLPTGLFRYNTQITNAMTTFQNTGLTSIPSDLFQYNTLLQRFDSVFQNCSSLTSIPAGLFQYNTAATAIRYAFCNNTSLTSIPSNLFQYNTQVTDFSGVFYNCSNAGLTSVPASLFQYNTLVIDFSSAFQNCTRLLAIPTSLFRYNTLARSFSGTFYGCNNITALPTDLFQYNTSATYFMSVFAYMSSLTTSGITSSLFQYNTQAISFQSAFAGCTSLTTVPAGLFQYNTSAQSFWQTFMNCTSLTTVPTDLFRYNTAATSFQQAFLNCTALATLPADLFTYNTQAMNFNQTFSGCTKLTSTSDMFGVAYTTRFLNQSVDFTNLMQRTTFTGTIGVAPALWTFSFGSGTATIAHAFNGAGNSATSLSNYASIPAAWL